LSKSWAKPASTSRNSYPGTPAEPSQVLPRSWRETPTSPASM